jgi:hypothetical protein|tara:strand:+ start:5585 stop:6016 length:432 start_codon:yes stop_codon:yes gene_type:complete
MKKARWFLAHSKQDDDEDIDRWCAELTDHMSDDNWDAEVVAGRDDYKSRAAALGGWPAWCRDVALGESYTGGHLFHGIIVPVDFTQESFSVGKATAQLIEGFIDAKKHIYAWCPDSHAFKQITGLEATEADDWTSWVTLIVVD